MNGVNGHVAPPVLWQEARNADGRVYYYNAITKATQWTKPEELMTPAEVSCAQRQLRTIMLISISARIGRSTMERIHR